MSKAMDFSKLLSKGPKERSGAFLGLAQLAAAIGAKVTYESPDGTCRPITQLEGLMAVAEGALQMTNQEKKKMSHNKFKMFVGPIEADDDFGKLAARVTAFGSMVASKSIGVEYLESSKKLVITLGYNDQETPFPIALTDIAIGRMDQIEENEDFSALEDAMGKATDEVTNVICHELFITDTGTFLMVILAKAKA